MVLVLLTVSVVSGVVKKAVVQKRSVTKENAKSELLKRLLSVLNHAKRDEVRMSTF